MNPVSNRAPRIGRLFGVTAALLGLVACAAPAPRDLTPKQLAQEQWDACADSPSLVLSEISEEGRIYYRERDASTPTTAFQRCLARVAYRQVEAGERPAKDIVSRAYFTDRPPPGGTVSEISGQAPPRKIKFDHGGRVYFYFVVEPTDRPLTTVLTWFSQNGIEHAERIGVGPTRSNYLGSWRTASMYIGPQRTAGLWGVRLMIDGRDAGEYIFNVVRR